MKPGVHQGQGDPVVVHRADLARLAQEADTLELRRSRICAHPDAADSLHEMLIALGRGSYIRPHRHHGRPESIHLIDGAMDVVFFHEDGTVASVLPMSSEGAVYYRLASARFHTMLVRTQTAIFHEVTAGPFRPEDTEFAPWAPPADGEPAVVEAYLAELSRRLPV